MKARAARVRPAKGAARARPAKERATGREQLAVYLDETRDIGLSLLMVLPLLLGYEIAVMLLAPPSRNTAELAVTQFVGRLPPQVELWLRRGLVLLLLAVAYVLARRRAPRVARARWVLLESLVFALLLGPLVGWMLGGFGLAMRPAAAQPGEPAWLPFVLSVGAGLWEEIVFRLALLGGLALLLVRGLHLQPVAATAIAVIVSSLAFALYHHLGAYGEPLVASRFAFRALAGTILGVLFATRGLAVVVYMHVFYDLLCDLRALHG